MCTVYYGVLPPFIRGRQVALLDGAPVEMEYLHDDTVLRELLVSEVSDAQLIQHLCRSRVVYSFTVNGSNYRQV